VKARKGVLSAGRTALERLSVTKLTMMRRWAVNMNFLVRGHLVLRHYMQDLAHTLRLTLRRWVSIGLMDPQISSLQKNHIDKPSTHHAKLCDASTALERRESDGQPPMDAVALRIVCDGWHKGAAASVSGTMRAERGAGPPCSFSN